jgi:hypothetical protein
VVDETVNTPVVDETPTTQVDETPTTQVDETPTTQVDETPTTQVDETTTTQVDETTTTQVDETVAVVDETTNKTPTSGDETPSTTTRQPSAELQAKANDVLKQITDANASVTDPKVKAANEAAAKKIQQILDEQAPGVTDALKARFMDELSAQIANPANAGKDMFTLIRDTVNAASVKDVNGQTQNPYLKQGEAIPLSALQDAGNMSRLYGTDKVFNMLTPQAKADLTAAGVTKDTFGTFLANNPNYDLRVNLDPKAFVEGYNDVAWWGLQSEGVATNVTELIDALALNPEYYQQGGIRFNATPETMAGAGVTKPTAFDGMFPEWVPTDVDNPFGVTGGGKQEGVAPRIEVEQIGQIEVFAGTPDQLVTGRGSPLKETFTNAGDTNGAALVDGVMGSSASNDVKARFLQEFEAQVKANPGKSSQDVYNDVLASNPDFAAVSPTTTTPKTTPVVDETVNAPETTPETTPESVTSQNSDAVVAPKNLSELAAHLSPDAKRGLEQFRALNGEGRLNETTRAYTDKNGDIDIAKAEKFFASKAMDDAAYQGRLGKIKQQKIDLAQQEVSKIKNIAAETDGTNRPNASVGDGTTEAALMHEVNTGQPLFSKEGHYLKVASYLKDLQAKIVTLQNLRADIIQRARPR